MKRFIKIFILAVFIFTSLGSSSNTYAMDRTFYSQNDILFFDPEASACPGQSGGATTALVGNDNTEKILRYFVDKGLTLEQASGIAGNFWQESRHRPNIIQDGATAADDYIMVDGTGFGIAQWTTGSRQVGLQALATSRQLPITDLLVQLDFAWSEMTTGTRAGSLTTLKATTTPEDAAFVFHRDFEGSADTREEITTLRLVPARGFFDQYSTIVASTSSTAGSCSGNGTPSRYIDGFAVYNQDDPQWSNNPYGTSTIGRGGCAPSALAAIITALAGRVVTPADTASYGAANGTWVEGEGSSWSIATIVPEHWGLTSRQLDGDIAEINTSLRAGGLVLVSGEGSVPFTTSGHFITIRAVTANNKWLIADSNGTSGLERSSQEWDPQSVISAGAKGYWEITK